jgi:hypothetical protein
VVARDKREKREMKNLAARLSDALAPMLRKFHFFTGLPGCREPSHAARRASSSVRPGQADGRLSEVDQRRTTRYAKWACKVNVRGMI